MYKASLIAKYIIAKENENNRIVSNLKLQKLLYFIQAEFLVSKNKPCFSDRIEAWDFGSVVPDVYNEYKVYGGAYIPAFFIEKPYIIAKDDCELIDCILDECGKYSSNSLLKIIHNQMPWKKAYDNYKIYGNNSITNESLIEFFSEK